MKATTIFAAAAVLVAVVGSVIAAAAGDVAAAPPRPGAGFDPVLAGAATCASASGRPLLGQLVLAQAETAPFRPSPSAAAPADIALPPLYGNLGTVHMAVTTCEPKAQAYFDQGLRLTFAFNHAEAARAFRAAHTIDPDCAMCWWGEALALGPNINAPMFPQAVVPAVAAARAAAALAPRAAPHEQALIRALALRYDPAPAADRKALDHAYANAMGEAARAFPNDDHIQVLFAESLMDLAPWDYWEAGGSRPKGRTAEMVDALERVLERNPRHPGAAHYYIHAVEASAHPEKALPYARALARQVPGAGHLVHMPSHIYYRVGLYRESLQANQEAIAADEAYFGGASSDPVYKGAYYPHNIHFAMVSALMGGDGRTALGTAAKLDKALPAALVKEFAMMQPVKAAPYFSHVQFSSPATLVALPDPGNELVLVKAMWHYARAVGYARKGTPVAADKEIAALTALERNADFKPLQNAGIPGRDIVRTARAVATGRAADARGNLAAAIAAYQEAVDVQDALPYTEPPYWYYPVRQSLGSAQLRAGRIDEAERTFRASLARTPSNGWALRGLIEVYRQRGDAAALAAAQQRFDTTWLGQDGPPALALL